MSVPANPEALMRAFSEHVIDTADVALLREHGLGPHQSYVVSGDIDELLRSLA